MLFTHNTDVEGHYFLEYNIIHSCFDYMASQRPLVLGVFPNCMLVCYVSEDNYL